MTVLRDSRVDSPEFGLCDSSRYPFGHREVLINSSLPSSLNSTPYARLVLGLESILIKPSFFTTAAGILDIDDSGFRKLEQPRFPL